MARQIAFQVKMYTYTGKCWEVRYLHTVIGGEGSMHSQGGVSLTKWGQVGGDLYGHRSMCVYKNHRVL